MSDVLRALAVVPLLVVPLGARLHEPQEPLDLMAGLRHVMASSAGATPAATKARDAGPAADARRGTRPGSTSARRRPVEVGSRGGAPGAVRGVDLGVTPVRLDFGEADAHTPTTVSPDDLIELGFPGRRPSRTDGWPGLAVPVVDRLAPERADHVVTALRPERRDRQPDGSATPRRARRPLPPAKLVPDGARAVPAVPRADVALDGSGHMEVHWTAGDGFSTFVGGSQAEEDAHSTAFGRDIGAEAGVQITDAGARAAYRLMVARTFKNDLDAPIQEARLRFEVNVRF